MKKLIAILCAALLALSSCALAEPPLDTLPNSDSRSAASGDAFEITIYGETISLDYDTSEQYSKIDNGQVQASYYRYSDDGKALVELFITFPESTQPGMVISPDYSALTNEESSVVLIISDMETQKESYYFSSLMAGIPYPQGSDYQISLDSVSEVDGATTFEGRLSATLVALNMETGEVMDTLVVPETPFRFTMGGSAVERPEAESKPTPQPDDMKRV